MINQAEVDRLYDCEVIDEHGERIGTVKQVWLDDRDGRPMWASVHTGLFGLKESFVPIQDATMGKGVVTVPVEKQQVKDAPRIDVSDQHMSDRQQDELYEYYGMIPTHRTGDHDRLPNRGRTETKPMPAAGHTSGLTRGEMRGGGMPGETRPEGRGTMRGQTTAGQAAAGQPATGKRGRHEASTGDSVTRYEEELDVGTREVEAGRVRLVKHTVTEQKDMTVPVTHEEVRVVREPAEGAPTSHAFTDEEAEAEVTLRRQEPVVEKKTRPVEKVRLDKQTVTEQERVHGEVRKERVDVERDDQIKRRDS
ncbi:hypothetical protein ADK67_06755 [Saccharothrix sp. NRRL B-16348]|uniref:DUF2382 domain-containing protein n=1 Tax=Saccharothrix sp. NRRL B-16348 TaxID=1415542 RepID=UPI0006AEB30C|nr:PRC and DUF2382 domain-containing protein [Saccharothrix sp. NRRL B-16348]KOX33246.1 hypothetical protein ADK67_06755 [Saccharothrix sp. NRRL B-16348]